MSETSRAKWWTVALALVTFALATTLWLSVFKFGGANSLREIDTAVALTGGNPAKGHDTIVAVGCAACHEIPGVGSARGKIGSSLTDFKSQATVAGVMANSADNLVRWLQHPREIDPKTAMPDLGLTEQQARDVAAYLYAPGH